MPSALRLSQRSRLVPSRGSAVSNITIRSISNVAGSNTAASAAVPKPSGVQVGDVMYVVVCTGNGIARTVTPPSGWALVGTTGPETSGENEPYHLVQRVYRRWVDGTEGSTFTFTASTSGVMDARCIALSGVDTTYPEDVPGVVGYNDLHTSLKQGGDINWVESGTPGTLSPPPVYVYTNGSLLIGFFAVISNAQSWGNTPGMTEQLDALPQQTGGPFLNGAIFTQGVNEGFQQKYPTTSATSTQAIAQLLVVRAANASTLPPYPTPIGNVYNINPPNHYLAIQQSIQQVPAGANSASKNIIRFPFDVSYNQSWGLWLSFQKNKVVDFNNSTFTATFPLNDVINHSFTLWRCEHFQLTNAPGIKGTPSIIGTFNPTQTELDTYLDSSGNRYSTPQVRSPAYVGNHPAAPSGNQFQSGVQVYGGNNITVDFLHIARVFGDGIAVTPYGQIGAGGHIGTPEWVYVRDCKIVRTARQGLAPTGTKHNWYERIEMIDIWYWGMDAEADSYGNDPLGQPIQDIHCLDSSIDGMWFGGLHCPNPYGEVDGVYFRGFVTKSLADVDYPPIWLNIYNSTRVMKNIEVTGCTLKFKGESGVLLHDVQNAIVTNNSITRVSGSGQHIKITHSPEATNIPSRTYTTTPNTLIG